MPVTTVRELYHTRVGAGGAMIASTHGPPGSGRHVDHEQAVGGGEGHSHAVR